MASSHDTPGAGRRRLSRRGFLAASAGAVAGGALASRAAAATTAGPAAGIATPTAEQAEALAVLGRTTLRLPNSRPFPSLAPGTDTLPGIEHIVVLMLENHSYDNLFGMLGRGKGQTPRGDGFTLDHHGRPTAANPYGDGRVQHAFRMPTTCQLPSQPSQEWGASHNQYNDGKMDGFVRSTISPATSKQNGPVAMGYWTEEDLPFTYDLATHFPVCDRFFCSLLGQTDPNRRYLIAGTSAGMTDDIGTSVGGLVPDATLPLPANGTIFDRLTEHGITWTDYAASYPLGATANLYPTPDGVLEAVKMTSISAFYADCAAGRLPAFSLLDPDFNTQSQENPQNIAAGEALLAQVVDAIGRSPMWHKTLFIYTYDEHGGYYDHVPPPVALAPDLVPPLVQSGEGAYDGFRRYGFRVPTVIVSPYAKKNHVSSVVHDITSILALVERKWNLPALTYRDANANDLTDCLDLDALAKGRPTFPSLPALRPANYNAKTMACDVHGPGTIPPPDSISGRVTSTARFSGRGRPASMAPR